MKRPFSRLGVGLALWFGAAAATGCTPSNKVKPGAPVLLSFGVVAEGQPFALKDDMDNEVPVPPLSTVVAVFDRLLDPTVLEDIVDGGLVPNAGVSSIETPDATIPSGTLYVPNGDAKFTLIYPPGPSITVMPDPEKGLPSDTSITVSLSPEHVRSHDQMHPFVAGDDVVHPLSFTTQKLAAAIDVPQPPETDGATDSDGGADSDAGADGGTAAPVAPPVDPTFVVRVVFNNLTDDPTGSAIKALGIVGGAAVQDLGAVVARSAEEGANVWTVSPPATGWPAGAAVAVSVGPTAVDRYGHTLAAAVTDTFTVKP